MPARLFALMTLGVLSAATVLAAEERSLQFDIGTVGDVHLTTELVVTVPGTVHVVERLFHGARASDVSAIDVASNRALATHVAAGTADIQLGRALPNRAEQRIAVHAIVSRRILITETKSTLELVTNIPPGRSVFLLPPGFSIDSSTPAAQFAVEGSRAKAGFVNAGDGDLRIRVHAGRTGVRQPAEQSVFRPEDDRAITYWLDDPATHRMTLALELVITNPGQAHVYSVLRKQDNITNPVALDVDRGVELKTRIVSGAEATAFGDSLTTFPQDASVLVGDLGYGVPKKGSVRIRLYETATDPTEYRRDEHGLLIWDRFLARLRTRAVLPPNWALASTTHPAEVHRDEKGRVVLDFVHVGADSPSLIVTAFAVGAPPSPASESR